MRLTNTFMVGIVYILNTTNFPNPGARQRAFISMRHLSEQTIRSTKAKGVHEMFRELRKRNLTLKTVKDLCSKMYSGKAEDQRRKIMERMVMELKEDDARKQRVTEERKMAYKWRAGEEVAILNVYKITRHFKDLARKESESE